MEVRQNPATRLFSVLVNGEAITNCSTSALVFVDCPGPMVCAETEPWAEFPAMCTCPVQMGFVGLGCDETTPLTVVVLFLGALAQLFALASLLMSLSLCRRTFCSKKGKKGSALTKPKARRRCPPRTTSAAIVAVTANSTLILLTTLWNVAGNATYPLPGNQVLVPYSPAVPGGPPRLLKRFSTSTAQTLILLLAAIITMSTMAYIALAWLEVAQRGARFRARTSRAPEIAVGAIIVVNICVLFPVGVGAATQLASTIMYVVVGVESLLFGVMYFVAFARLARLAEDAQRQSVALASPGVTHDQLAELSLVAGERVAALRRMRRTTLALSVTAFLTCALGIVTGAAGPQRSATYAPPGVLAPPSENYREVTFRLMVLGLVGMNAIMAWSLWASAPTKRASSLAASNGNAPNKKAVL